MPHIPSANPDSELLEVPSDSPNYSHGLERRKTVIPMAFQITSPFNTQRVLLPHALVMHINPQDYSENHTKKVERIQTRGGFVEQHWGDELTDISASGSTGAFMNIYTGLSSVLRQKTIAWDRYRDLHDLYRNNGSVYDPYGNIVLQGHVMLMYDRGTYIGYFRSFEVEETDDQPFVFKLSWNFKVEEELMKIPALGVNPAARGTGNYVNVPQFQSRNNTLGNIIPTTTSSVPQSSDSELAAQADALLNASFNGG